VDVGRLRTGRGHWASAAACALTLLLTAGTTSALASTPPPPPPPTTGGGSGGGGGVGGGGGGGATTPPPSGPSQPPPDTTAPGRVSHLRIDTRVPHRITITWTNPGARDLAGIDIRRERNVCPAGPGQGIRVGGTSVRTRQVDSSLIPGAPYCYAVFAFDHNGNYSQAAIARNVVAAKPPPPLTSVSDVQAAATTDGHIQLSWINPKLPQGATILVRRGPASACPAGPAEGTPIGGSARRTRQVDTTAKRGSSYCYRVFVVDNGASKMASTQPTPVASPAPAVHPAAAADPAAASSGSWLTSMIVRTVAGVGAAMLPILAAATFVARRRTHVSAYAAPRAYVPRMALTGVTPATLLIPAVLVVGSAAAIVLVLLNH
jgi:hypothetical protein